MNVIGADPFVMKDPKTGTYYAYATGDEDIEHFIIYKSKDLHNWEKVGFAYHEDEMCWGKDWFWAPECYYNPHNEHYYLFYSARVKLELTTKYFGRPDFLENAKIGVAVSATPEGPFHNLANHPIDYYPFDYEYRDVDALCQDAFAVKVSETDLSKAKKGTYIPSIDADMLVEDGHIYLFYSRCCYENNLPDQRFDKFVEESNILAVELDPAFWYDKEAKMMPTIHPSFVAYDAEHPEIRKDKWVQIISYCHEPQEWENGHISDYESSHGQKHNRRWAEGSMTIPYVIDGVKKYLIFYSCNNYENALYGIGVAVADQPLGPYHKYGKNPIIHQVPDISLYSTGHGCVVEKDGELYYVFHGRESMDQMRILYQCKLHINSFDDITISDIVKENLI